MGKVHIDDQPVKYSALGLTLSKSHGATPSFLSDSKRTRCADCVDATLVYAVISFKLFVKDVLS